jgi:hypothetical protein
VPSLVLIFALVVALSAQFMGHMLLAESPRITTTSQIIIYLAFSAALIVFARLGLRWIGDRPWGTAMTFLATLIFMPWWGISTADLFAHRRPLWVIIIRLTGLGTVIVIAVMSIQKFHSLIKPRPQ